jgi:molybdate transport system regulatory protein
LLTEERAMAASIRITARVITKGERAFGPGKADLLERIAVEGSISRAAKAMDMSYSRAWQLVDTMNAAFRKPLVEPKTGGRKGGGASLTRAGEEILSIYRQMEEQLAADAEAFFPEFEKRLK